MAKSKRFIPTARLITTVYYGPGHEKLKTLRSTNPNLAVERCVSHMQINHYGATYAEVYHEETTASFATIKRNIKGNLSITYGYDPRTEEQRYAVTPTLDAVFKKK